MSSCTLLETILLSVVISFTFCFLLLWNILIPAYSKIIEELKALKDANTCPEYCCEDYENDQICSHSDSDSSSINGTGGEENGDSGEDEDEVGPSNKTEPISSGKAAPLGPEGGAWCARRAPRSQLIARSFSRGVVARPGCDLKS